MLTYKQIHTMFCKIRKEAGSPHIRLWAWNSAISINKSLKKNDYGTCRRSGKAVIAINPDQPITCALNSIWHEIGHILFRSKGHTWINRYARIMSRFTYRGYFLPVFFSRKELLRKTIRQSNKLGAKEREDE